MKRLLPESLIDFWQANPNCLKADLFVIALPNGQTIHATEGQWDLTIPSGTAGWLGSTTTFSATEYGRWSRGPVTSEASFNLSANSMSLTCVPNVGGSGTLYPGVSVGILQAAWNGLFDAATVTVYTAYMPFGSYGDVSNGIETKWVGFIEKITNIDRVMVEFECQDPLYLLNQKVPGRIIQSACPWSFCDANCTLSAATYTVGFTASGSSTSSILVPSSAFTQAVGYFSQGVVTCTAGNNKGLSQTVKLHDSSGHLELVMPFILPVLSGDTFSVIKGCDKSFAMCGATITPSGSSVNNTLHFGGEIAVPQPIQAI
jgi:uncharacterized phage protein (TIGR02218 family)